VKLTIDEAVRIEYQFLKLDKHPEFALLFYAIRGSRFERTALARVYRSYARRIFAHARACPDAPYLLEMARKFMFAASLLRSMQ
jgi:hypothetical protein